MNQTTRFTQTKFKEKRPAPQPPTTKKHRKRCAPQPPDGESSGPRESTSYSPPPAPPILKSFLLDIAQEVVTVKPIDMIDHLAQYTQNLQTQLRARREKEEEENGIRMLMEEKAKQLEVEDRATRTIQMAFRGFKAKKREKDDYREYVVKGVTLEQANKAASCIQRNYRRHAICLRVKAKLASDAAKGDPTGRSASQKDGEVSEDTPLKEGDSVKELYGPKTPYKAEGDNAVESTCPMAAPLLLYQTIPAIIPTASDETVNDDNEDYDEYLLDMKRDTIWDTDNISLGSLGEVHDTDRHGSIKSQEDSAKPARSSQSKPNEEDTEMAPPPPAAEHSSESVTKVTSGEEQESTEDVPADSKEKVSPNSSDELGSDSLPEYHNVEADDNNY